MDFLVLVDDIPTLELTLDKVTTVGEIKKYLNLTYPEKRIRFYVNSKLELKTFETDKYDNMNLESIWEKIDKGKIYLDTVKIKTIKQEEKMSLENSLKNYSLYLEEQLLDQKRLEEFKKLAKYDYVGCFCEPDSECHTDIIRNKLGELGLNVPKRQCVKVKYLRKDKRGDNLEDWVNNGAHCLCTRRGRIFIGSKEDKRIYHYKESPWHNPYKVE